MRKVNTLPPVEIYGILHEAEAADIAIPKVVDKWWEEETALNSRAQPPQADNSQSNAIALLTEIKDYFLGERFDCEAEYKYIERINAVVAQQHT